MTDPPPPLDSCKLSRVSTSSAGTQGTSQSPSCASKGCGSVWVWLYLCVHMCVSDGVGRTGSFICIHAMMERVNTENILDFFQFIKSSRIHRPSLIMELVGCGCGLSRDDVSVLSCCRNTIGFAMMPWLTTSIVWTVMPTSRICRETLQNRQCDHLICLIF